MTKRLHAISVDDLKEINRSIYLGDFLISYLALIFFFVLFVRSDSIWVSCLFFAASIFAIYRSAVFAHEISHMGHKFPVFVLLWNLTCGVVTLLPSFYFRSHVDHHRGDSYGTVRDPEYIHFWGRRNLPVKFVLLSMIVPFFQFFRFAVLVPIGCFVPKTKLLLERSLSLLSMHSDYSPSAHIREKTGFESMTECFVACFCLGAIMFAIRDVHFFIVTLQWLGILSFANAINSVRTVYAHRYRNSKSPVSFAEQVADSTTINFPSFLSEIIAPVGLRYHAAHHLFPFLPYHALPEAHRRLCASNTEIGQLYRQTFI